MQRKILTVFMALLLISGAMALNGCGFTSTAGYHYPTTSNDQIAQDSATPAQTQKTDPPTRQTTKVGTNSQQSADNSSQTQTTNSKGTMRQFAQAFVDKTLQLFMRYGLEYKDVSLFALKKNTTSKSVKAVCSSDGKMTVYGPSMTISTGRAIIREIVRFETAEICAQIPEFWSQTLTEMVIQEITPDTNAYTDRENAGLCQQLMQFFGQQTGKTREEVYQIMMTYFLKQDASGLRQYADSCAGIKIFDDMTTNHNENVQILYERLN